MHVHQPLARSLTPDTNQGRLGMQFRFVAFARFVVYSCSEVFDFWSNWRSGGRCSKGVVMGEDGPISKRSRSIIHAYSSD